MSCARGRAFASKGHGGGGRPVEGPWLSGREMVEKWPSAALGALQRGHLTPHLGGGAEQRLLLSQVSSQEAPCQALVPMAWGWASGIYFL